MAKTIMPLMSASASGALAKTVVYMTWKGINDVRKYVIPANPRSTRQVAQRILFENAVDAFHAVALTAVDLAAWDSYAGTLAKMMSGFNSFVRQHIKWAIAEIAYHPLWDFDDTQNTEAAHTITIMGDSTNTACYLRYGKSKTYMPSVITGTFAVDTFSFDTTPMTPGVKYFCWVDWEDIVPERRGRTGIYAITQTPT